MNSKNLDKLNEIKALEDSLKSIESFDPDNMSKQSKTLLIMGGVLFIISLILLFQLSLPFESYAVGACLAISMVLLHFSSFLGKTAFYTRYTRNYLDIKAMKKRLKELKI